MSLITTIKLHPTLLSFDLWACEDQQYCIEEAMRRYDWAEKESSELFSNREWTASIELGDNAEADKGVRYCVGLHKDSSYCTIAHECYHLLHYLAKDVDLPLDYDSQEWGAYMIGYIFNEIEKAIKQ